MSGRERPLPRRQIRGLVHVDLVSNLSPNKPKNIPEDYPKTVRMSVFTNEYSALNPGKFLPKNTGRK